MAGENNGSVTTGSPIASSVPNPNTLGAATGQTQNQSAQIDPTQHKELESLVGRQGAELGELRKFFQDISPLLDKLDKSPEIVQAIIDGKVTSDLAKAALEGKVQITDAQIVSKAHAEVKKELGKEGYKAASPEEINQLVEDKAKAIEAKFDTKFKEQEEMRSFEDGVNDFIARTPDFKEHAPEIEKWLDEHDVTDIAVAYYAVKGELSVKEARKQAEADAAEFQKSGALNAGGGSGRATHIRGDGDIVDSLISGKSNPNVF